MKRRSLPFGVAAPTFLLLCGSLPASAAPLTSGRYEQLNLAVAADGNLTGVYTDQQGQGVVKKCTFVLAGRIDATGTGTVAAWTTWVKGGPIKRGRIDARGDTVTLAVPGAQDFPGCGMVLPPDIDKGIAFSRTTSVPWTSMRMISALRAPLHVAPDGTATRGHVVRGDVVGVRAAQGGRLSIDYVSTTGRMVGGWVRAAQTASLAPPR